MTSTKLKVSSGIKISCELQDYFTPLIYNIIGHQWFKLNIYLAIANNKSYFEQNAHFTMIWFNSRAIFFFHLI